MKKFKLMIAVSAALLIAAMAYAASYAVFSTPEPGEYAPIGFSVGKIEHTQISGALPSTGTVILSRVSANGATTNALLTVTCSAGSYDAAVGDGTNIYLVAGDRLLRSGTVTNDCQVRYILTGD